MPVNRDQLERSFGRASTTTIPRGGPGPVIALLTSGALRLGYSLGGDEAAVAALVAKYADVPMDLADACIVRMSERVDRCEVVTIDGDFHVYRRHGDQAIPVVHPAL